MTFRPRLTLQTLTRGDGLLGLAPDGDFGPRGGSVTVAQVDWTYVEQGRVTAQIPAPTSVLNARPPAWQRMDDRDWRAEAEALDRVRALGLQPLSAKMLQWRTPDAAKAHPGLWSMPQESMFGALWAEQVPLLQAAGWQVVVRPGFEHLTGVVSAWRLVVDAASGEPIGHVPLDAQGREGSPLPGSSVQRLSQPAREGSWLLSLGVEVDGELMDLAPLLADLLRRDRRWLRADTIDDIDDEALVMLRAPGGRRVEAAAGPLKKIVGAMVDLLTDPRRRDGPLVLSSWDDLRLESLRASLMDTQADRTGPHGCWQLQGDHGLRTLAERLRQAGEPASVTSPDGLGVTLRPYQLQGVAWLQYLREQHLAGILADDMGLGKTAQMLAHVLIEKQAGRLDAPALVVMPTTLLFNWQAEARQVAPALRVLTWHGAQRADAFAQIEDHDLVLTSFPLVWRDVDILDKINFHLVILDEAQTVKNAGTRAADAVRRLQARHRLCMTGTPLENHLGELWAQFDFLLPGYLGDARSFTRLWRKPIEENGETLRAQLLAQRIRPFVLRRRKVDVAPELPPKTEVIERVQLEGAQRDLYESVRVAADELVRRALKRSGFSGAQISILDALLKLRQVCCDPYLVKGAAMPADMPRAKIERLSQMLPELVEAGRRILVFSQFAEMLQLIEVALTALALPYLTLTGRTPTAERAERVARFQAREVPIFLVSLKAGGTGLNLTAADTVVHVDPWWNPAVEQQATDRAHRIGQDQPVFVYRLVVAGSIEERMLALQERKAALADGVLGTDTADASKFSTQDLDALLAPLELR